MTPSASSTRLRRHVRRAAVLGATALPLLATATPALALDDGEVPGPSLGAGMTIVYYVIVPLGFFAIIAFLSVLPSMLRRPRYRPGRPWNYDPLWFGGPDDPEQAVRSARTSGAGKGGASAEW